LQRVAKYGVPNPVKKKKIIPIDVAIARRRVYLRRHYQKHREDYIARWHARRARILGVTAERVDRLAVFERDGWVCRLCQKPVLRCEASLDHIVPISRGGEHSYANVQLAHLECNRRKGAQVA
jgi:5-methylcytosine-specific restriction endonuclease McrA